MILWKFPTQNLLSLQKLWNAWIPLISRIYGNGKRTALNARVIVVIKRLKPPCLLENEGIEKMEKKHTRLNSQTDCRRFLARAINETKAGAMKPDFLRALTYSIKVLSQILSDSDLEERIAKLENQILNRKVLKK